MERTEPARRPEPKEKQPPRCPYPREWFQVSGDLDDFIFYWEERPMESGR